MRTDNESFGLTEEDYEFPQDDISHAIAETNKKIGYGGFGYVDEDGNHYRFPDDNKPKRSRSKPESKAKSRTKRPSVEEIAIAIGILHVIKPESESNEAKQ